LTSAEYNQEFQKRTKRFALAIIKLTESVKKTESSMIIGRQLLRSAFSVAANYRATCIARSDKERYSKLCIVVEETDESHFWLEMLVESGLVDEAAIASEFQEAKELLRVFMAYRSKLQGVLKS
jgi:four helix bundle protein